MQTKSIIAIGIGLACLLCSCYISYTIIQRGFRYYGLGRDYVEQGHCTIISSVIQNREIEDATPREGPLATMRAYYQVNYISKKNETIQDVSAISRMDDAGWTGDVNSVSADLAKYVPGNTVRCIKGRNTLAYYAKDLNSVEHLIVLDKKAKEIKRKFHIAFYSGIAVGIFGVLVLVGMSIFVFLHERWVRRGIRYSQIQ